MHLWMTLITCGSGDLVVRKFKGGVLRFELLWAGYVLVGFDHSA